MNNVVLGATSKSEPIDYIEDPLIESSEDMKGSNANRRAYENRGQPMEEAPKSYNDAHPEHKLYNELARTLSTRCQQAGISANKLEGELLLYTERRMCSGCNISATRFENMFPKIKVTVFYDKPYPQM